MIYADLPPNPLLSGMIRGFLFSSDFIWANYGLFGISEEDAGLIQKDTLCTGRAYLIKSDKNPLFLTGIGKRITKRRIEQLVEDYVSAYVPGYLDKRLPPHKLRATCATRILTQTHNIALAAEQLGHQNISTTSAFYAKVQRKMNEQLAELPVNEW